MIQALFRENSNGTYYEAAVPSNSGSQEFEIPFDATIFAATGDQFFTGFAIANLDPLSPATIICTARDQTGAVIPNVFSGLTGPPAMIAGFGHWAGFNFPALMGLRGTIDCTANTNIAATALRFMGNKAFSSLPVIDKALAPVPSGTALPQFAAQDVWTTGIFAINTSAAPAKFSITFRQDSGALAALPFNTGTSSTLGQFTLPANGSGYYETGNPSGTLLSGWGQITADPAIVTQALFREEFERHVFRSRGSFECGQQGIHHSVRRNHVRCNRPAVFYRICDCESGCCECRKCELRGARRDRSGSPERFHSRHWTAATAGFRALVGVQLPGSDGQARYHRLHVDHDDRRDRAALHRQHRVFIPSGGL